MTCLGSRLLTAHPWPGNLRELHDVVAQAARGRIHRDIIDIDLPQTLQRTPPRTLSGMEVAERDAIIAALQSANGNKAAAAIRLGVGRTTLYQRLRRYRLD